MKKFSNLFFLLSLISTTAISNEYMPPLENISVTKNENGYLSIHNLSAELVTVDIYGDLIELPNSYGISYDCKGYYEVELIIKNNEHDYFEVPCQSQVIFKEDFKNEKTL